MNSPREFFHLATITLDGATKIFAIGGRSGSSYLNSIEDFNPETKTWTLTSTTFEEKRYEFGQVVIQLERVCPNREGKGCRFKEKS